MINNDKLINKVLTRGVDHIFPTKEKLANLMRKRKIILYQGFDPSMPSLHLGHLAGLMKLRQFQKLGHKVIFLVGDFTGMIGDPTDKLAARKKLTRKQVLKNAEKWKKQVEKVLDFTGPNKAEIKFNSEWLDKISFKDLIEITSNFTVQQMLERNMFQKRLKENKPIHLHEFLYPVAQAIDCVRMNVNLEVGGNDQLFNMLIGRTLMKVLKSKEKFVLSTKLLVDKNNQKVGKTTGNALFLDSDPNSFYGGIMSFPDETIALAFELFTEVSLGEELNKKIKKDPMREKKRLAFEIVKFLWGEDKAEKTEESFKKNFQERKEIEYKDKIKLDDNLTLTIAKINSVKSISQAKRLISEGAVDVNGKTTTDPIKKIFIGDRIKIGKKIFVKVARK